MATTMRVHRCSFVDWVPDAVQVLAFDPDGAALAVARGNGNVELWSRNDSWAMRAVSAQGTCCLAHAVPDKTRIACCSACAAEKA